MGDLPRVLQDKKGRRSSVWRVTQNLPPGWTVISEDDLAPAMPYQDSPFVVRLRPEKFQSMRQAAEFARGLSPDRIIQFYQQDDHEGKAQCSLYPGKVEPNGGYVDEGGGVG